MHPTSIAVIGTGYVGLAAAAGLSYLGHNVTGVDVDEAQVAVLRDGGCPIYEPGLVEMLDSGRAAKLLRFTTNHRYAVEEADAVFICVGSPTDAAGQADLSYVYEAIRQIAPTLSDGAAVVIKSTVPVGTTANVRTLLQELRPNLSIGIAANPEFLRQGRAIHDFLHPDRIVVGTDEARVKALIRGIYQPLLDADSSVVLLDTDIETAELVKYASNAFLAVKLSFINEIADLCEQTGANIEDVAAGVGMDPRIGPAFLKAGPGFGGSCLPKDTQALLHTSRVHGAPSRLVAAAVDVNVERRRAMLYRVERAIGHSLTGATVAVLGITFKAGTDDLRDSPSVDIVRDLVGHGAAVRVTDPEGMERAAAILHGVEFFDDPYDAVSDADAVVVGTEWPEFAELDLGRIADTVESRVLVDLRNLIDPGAARDAGFEYHSIGRSRP
ncbi:MAG: UDP-glucose/GDP-mannose dehydrogenase family protein [Actinomycetota bacterium]|nr:UDP-glucose/GDP-mannose dehydrogenase family protein [Actinomycetota bacterium]